MRKSKQSKAEAFKDAHRESEADRWQCRTCIAPAQEHSMYCMSCEMYWNDLPHQFDY